MKKGLLFIFGAVLCLSTQIVKGQDFDLDFYQYFNSVAGTPGPYSGSSTAKSAATKWRGSNNGDPALEVTMNGISASVDQNNRINNISVGDDNTTTQNFVRFQLTRAENIIIITSPTDLASVALVYRGTTDTNEGRMQVSYGTDASSLSTETAAFPAVMSASAPGEAKFFNFPTDLGGATNVRYIQIAINGSQTKLYRIAASTSTFTTLPLKLLSFTAKADAFGKSVNLNWKTTSEVNTSEFIVEKRTDDTGFSPIGSIKSENSDGVHSYSYADNNVFSGNIYYRLKQVDKNGEFNYSDVVSVNVEGGVSISLYPNPTSNLLNVTHNTASSASLKVFSLDGKSVIDQSLTAGSTLTNVDVSGLTVGTYVLVLNNAGKQSTIKFVKN